MAEITVWRTVKSAYLDSAFTGEGSLKFGGRFNFKGHAMVYCSQSISLTLLEMMVQINRTSDLGAFWSVPISFSSKDVIQLTIDQLPENWDAIPFTRITQEIGTNWLMERKSLALAVPSVVVPQEFNYLINPEHPRFSSCTVGKAIQPKLDSRLFRTP